MRHNYWLIFCRGFWMSFNLIIWLIKCKRQAYIIQTLVIKDMLIDLSNTIYKGRWKIVTIALRIYRNCIKGTVLNKKHACSIFIWPSCLNVFCVILYLTSCISALFRHRVFEINKNVNKLTFWIQWHSSKPKYGVT